MGRTPVDFVFRCRQDFASLPGDDPVVRRCDHCQTDVTDLDLLGDAELDEFLRHADAVGRELCARSTVVAIDICGNRKKLGTYTGRTAAQWRRLDQPIYEPREGETMEDFMRRVTAESAEHQREIDALLDRVRARQPRAGGS